MHVKLQVAIVEDVAELLSLRTEVNQHLASRYGEGYRSSGLTAKGVLYTMKTSTVYVARDRNRLIATLTLSTRKPWAIDKSYFAAGRRPLYLTAMAVAPRDQRRGVGRQCIDEVRRIARCWPGDSVRLDAYDAEAGAGDFYRKCGFTEVGRHSYREVPLIYFEMLLDPLPA